MKKFVAGWDAHIGWEKHRVDGQLVTWPTHDEHALTLFKKFVGDFEPDLILLGGDNLNCSFISRHNRAKPRLVEGFSAIAEYKEADRLLYSPLDQLAKPGCKKVTLAGNHEYWIEMFLDENPSVEGLLEPDEYLKLDERGWGQVDFGRKFQYGKLYFSHGDVPRTGAMYVAKKFVEAYGKSIAFGHYHTSQSHVGTAMADNENHVAIAVPALCRPGHEYAMDAPSNQVQGFLYGYTWGDGSFNAYTVIITDGKFAAEGRLYR